MPLKTDKQETALYQLKVTLMGIKPPIWRRIQVTGNTKLSRLHDILQIVMGWTNSHLHMFNVR
ncbi:MAG TPA: plasmid pRiA4b ORF-3 family protein, partial [Thermodesulfovibrionales bacterium]|nr:plasmid pRiA4b ORF-3 family protein [Thermodesulfovibrionales bacterium]